MHFTLNLTFRGLKGACLTVRSVCAAALLLAAPPIALCAPAAPGAATQARAVKVAAAWIRWLPAGVPLAGYATLTNASARPIVLVAAASSYFHEVDIHRTVNTGGTMQMSPAGKITIAPHATLDFFALGYHMMLMQPTASLDAKSEIPITLRFADGSSLDVPFQVRRTGAAAVP